MNKASALSSDWIGMGSGRVCQTVARGYLEGTVQCILCTHLNSQQLQRGFGFPVILLMHAAPSLKDISVYRNDKLRKSELFRRDLSAPVPTWPPLYSNDGYNYGVLNYVDVA